MRTLVWVALLALVACQSDREYRDRLEKLESRVAGIEGNEGTAARFKAADERMAKVEERLDKAETTEAEYWFRLYQLESASKTTSLDPGGRGYFRVDSPTGTFLISIEDVKPFLDGSRLTLEIGNPSTATYKSFKMTVKWGPRFDAEKDAYAKWQTALKKQEFSFTDTLKPGTWNPVVLTLTPGKPDQLGFLEVSELETSEVSLSRSKND